MQPGISSDINMFGHVLDIAMLSEGNWEQNKMLQQRNHREHWPKIKEILIFSINSNPKVGGDSKAHGETVEEAREGKLVPKMISGYLGRGRGGEILLRGKG